MKNPTKNEKSQKPSKPASKPATTVKKVKRISIEDLEKATGGRTLDTACIDRLA